MGYFSVQLSRMSDEELRDLGLPLSAITQLRSILTKQVPTNGIGPTIDINVKKKIEPPEPEVQRLYFVSQTFLYSFSFIYSVF